MPKTITTGSLDGRAIDIGWSFRIGAYTFGGVRDVWTTDKVELGIGSDLTFYSKPPILDAIYGNSPISWKLFFRIRPGKMDLSTHGMHGTNRIMDQSPTTPKRLNIP
jgi:hypothetical protein